MAQRPAELNSPQTEEQDPKRENRPTSPAADGAPERSATEEDVFDASEYVRQLIARMGGDDAPVASAPAEPKIKAPERPVARPAPVSVAALPLGDAPNSLDELRSADRTPDSSRAPQTLPSSRSAVDLEKLREAANIMSSSVFHTFDCKGLVRHSYAQFGLAAGSMVISMILLSMSDEVRSIAFGTSVALMVVATVSTFRYAVTTHILGVKLRSSK